MNDVLQILTSFGAGILSFFSPCIFSVVPAYICFITGLSFEELSSSRQQSSLKNRLILSEALLFILGFSFIFVALGASASFLGAYLAAYKKLIRIIGGIIIILFGLQMLGLLKIKFLAYEKKFHLKAKPMSWLGSFLVGMAFGAGWTPCVSPMLGAILMLAAAAGNLTKGVILLSFYSLGMALPFFLVSVGITWVVNLSSKIKKYLRIVTIASGVLLLILGLTILLPGLFAEKPAANLGQREQGRQAKEPASNFALPTIDGQTIQLSDFKGKLIILNFWGSFCLPCRQEIPEFIKLYDEYKDKGLVIIGVNLDITDMEELKKFATDKGINYHIAKADAQVTERYSIQFIPATFIIDQEMNIVKKFVGYNPMEVFKSEIAQLLKK